MNLRCPACGCSMSLEALVDDAAASSALRQALELSAPIGPLLVRYLALFRPVKSRLTWSRVNALLGELRPAITGGRIERDGRVHDIPSAAWCSAMEAVLAARDAGQLKTPLKSHGYLYEVAISHAARLQAGGFVAGTASEVEAVKPQTAAPRSATARAIATLEGLKRPGGASS